MQIRTVTAIPFDDYNLMVVYEDEGGKKSSNIAILYLIKSQRDKYQI